MDARERRQRVASSDACPGEPVRASYLIEAALPPTARRYANIHLRPTPGHACRTSAAARASEG